MLKTIRDHVNGTYSPESNEIEGDEGITEVEVNLIREQAEEQFDEVVEIEEDLCSEVDEVEDVVSAAGTALRQITDIDAMDSLDAAISAPFANVKLEETAARLGTDPVLIEIDEVGDVSTEGAMSWVGSVFKGVLSALTRKGREYKRSLSLLSNNVNAIYGRVAKVQNLIARRKGDGGINIKLADKYRTNLVLGSQYSQNPVADLQKAIDLVTIVVDASMVEYTKFEKEAQEAIANLFAGSDYERFKSFDLDFVESVSKKLGGQDIHLLGNRTIAAGGKKGSNKKGPNFFTIVERVDFPAKMVLNGLDDIVSLDSDTVRKYSETIRKDILPQLAALSEKVYGSCDRVEGTIVNLTSLTEVEEGGEQTRMQRELSYLLSDITDFGYDTGVSAYDMYSSLVTLTMSTVALLEESVIQD